MLEMSRSHLHWSLHPTGEGGCLMYLLPFCFLPISVFALFSHMLIAFCPYCSLSHFSHTLRTSSFASYRFIINLYLSLPIFNCLPIHSQFLSLADFYYSVYFYFTIIHLESVLISYSLTLSQCTYSSSISISSCLFQCLSHGVQNSKSHLPKNS